MESVSQAAPRGQFVTQPSATHRSFGDLYERHYVRLVRVAVLLVLGDVGRAEEIVQDAFADLVARWRINSRPSCSGAPTLRTCVANGAHSASAASCGRQSTTAAPAVAGAQRGDGGAGSDRA